MHTCLKRNATLVSLNFANFATTGGMAYFQNHFSPQDSLKVTFAEWYFFESEVSQRGPNDSIFFKNR